MQQRTFQPTYSQNGIWVLKLQEIPLPSTFPARTFPYIVHFEPGRWGGDHVHERQEAFVGIGKGLHIVWRDEHGRRYEAPMDPADGTLRLFMVPAWMAHMVENRSKTASGVLYEIRDIDLGEVRKLEGSESLRAAK